VRLIAATNRDLAREVRAGRFRLDLYYRLNVVQLTTEPLRNRPEDIAPLCTSFLGRLAVENGLPSKRVSPAALRLLMSCSWPGNVRQLHNVLERAALLTDAAEIGESDVRPLLEPEETGDTSESPVPLLAATRLSDAPEFSPADDLSPGCGSCRGPEPPCRSAEGAFPTLAECESRLLRFALETCHWNQSAAARLLHIDRRLLRRKMHFHDLQDSRSTGARCPHGEIKGGNRSRCGVACESP
jgi:two-component system, response regulator FlrC